MPLRDVELPVILEHLRLDVRDIQHAPPPDRVASAEHEHLAGLVHAPPPRALRRAVRREDQLAPVPGGQVEHPRVRVGFVGGPERVVDEGGAADHEHAPIVARAQLRLVSRGRSRNVACLFYLAPTRHPPRASWEIQHPELVKHVCRASFFLINLAAEHEDAPASLDHVGVVVDARLAFRDAAPHERRVVQRRNACAEKRCCEEGDTQCVDSQGQLGAPGA